MSSILDRCAEVEAELTQANPEKQKGNYEMKKILIKITPTITGKAKVIDICTFRDIRFYITQLPNGRYRYPITEPFSGHAIGKGNTIQEALEKAREAIMNRANWERFLRSLVCECGGTILNDIPLKGEKRNG
mgnify:CR=1 FL=1